MINNELQNLHRNGIMGITGKGGPRKAGRSDIQGRSIKECQTASTCRADVHEFGYPAVHGSSLITLHRPNRSKHMGREDLLSGGKGILLFGQ